MAVKLKVGFGAHAALKSSAQVPRPARSTPSGHLRQKEVYVNLFLRQETHRRASIIGPAEIMQELSASHAKYVLKRVGKPVMLIQMKVKDSSVTSFTYSHFNRKPPACNFFS